MDPTIGFRLAVALAVGFIVGVERGWQSRESPEGLHTAGMRTFGFAGLFGGAAALLASDLGAAVVSVALLGFAAVVTAGYVLSASRGNDLGMTTETALLLTFALGAFAARGYEAEAVAAAVVVAIVLEFKVELHRALRLLDRRELTATLQLLVIAAVALPLLPARDMGPWQALNPRAIGFLVLLVAGLSWTGYFAVRLFGERAGLLATAFLGGLTSSTAVTVTFARLARRPQASLRLLGAGVALAAGTMAPRLLVEVGLVNPRLVRSLVIPLACLAFVPLAGAVLIARGTEPTKEHARLALSNPLQIETALAYGAAFAFLFFLIHAAKELFGDAGVYGVAAISGLVDVDALALSLARAAERDVAIEVAATGVIVAAMVNTIVKAVLLATIGGYDVARWGVPVLLAAVLGTVAALAMGPG